MNARRIPAILTATAATAIVAAGCGHSSSSGSNLPGTSAPSRPGQTVGQMVLNSGDVAAYEQQSEGSETLHDQFPLKGDKNRAATIALLKKNWLASRHTILIDESNNYTVESDANLFKTTAATKKIWKLELPSAGGQRLRTPAGSPPHAVLIRRQVEDGYEYVMGWQRGRTMSFVIVSSASNTAGGQSTPAFALQAITQAAQAQDAKVKGALLIADGSA